MSERHSSVMEKADGFDFEMVAALGTMVTRMLVGGSGAGVLAKRRFLSQAAELRIDCIFGVWQCRSS